MRNVSNFLLPGTLLAISLALGGCGGGSSSDDLEDEEEFLDSALLLGPGGDADDAGGVVNSDLQLLWAQKNKYDFYRLFVNPDGRSGFTKIGKDIPKEKLDDDADDSPIFLSRLLQADLRYEITAFLFKWPDALFLLKGCKGVPGDSECEQLGLQTAREASTGTVDFFTTPSPDNQFVSTFGISVAISNDALVTAIGANTASLFECTEDEIIDVDGEATENCERQVFPECEDIPEGEEAPDECPDPAAPVYKVIENAGAVYLYTREDVLGNWSLAQVLSAPNAGRNDNLGWSVAISDDGSLVVATAPGEDSSERSRPKNNSEESSGAAYVYSRDGDQWDFKSYIKAANLAGNDLFGWTTAVSGDGSVIAVGAVQRAACEGAVYTYEPNDKGIWIQTDFIASPQGGQNDLFGHSVSLDYAGKTLAAGAPQFPFSDLVLGCVPIETAGEAGTGAAYLFERAGSKWDLQSSIVAENADKADRFGWSVSLNGNSAGNGRAGRLLVGAPTESSSSSGVNGSAGNDELAIASGAAYLFERRSSSWKQTQYFKASNTGATDQFGNSVSLTDSGTILAIGAWGESGSGAGVNPVGAFDFVSGSGAVYVFQEDATPGLWSEVAYVKSPIFAAFASFGWSIDVADENKALLIGAPGFRGGPSVSGSAFLY